MRVYTIIDDNGFSTGEFFDDFSHPPVTELKPVKPEDAPDDLPESEWPLVEVELRRNDKIPQAAVEVGEAGRAKICTQPQNWKWDAGTATLVYVEHVIEQTVPLTASPANWRAGLDLWMIGDKSKLSILYEAVNRVVATGNPIGKVARQELEYASSVQMTRLLKIREAFGFSEADCDESMWRAGQVAAGDYRGVWPLPDGESPSKIAP